MKLLAIDGGGIRGIYASHVLERIQREFSTVFDSEFDLIAGTSTGSIIAAAIAFGIPVSKVTELYRETGPSIFKPKKWTFGGTVSSRYSSEPLRTALVISTLGHLLQRWMLRPTTPQYFKRIRLDTF